MGEIVLFVDNFNEISFCRICHEAEFESCSPLEAPCACSGTSKFAHRECIQKWCDEKGDTVCEICLQMFKPGYTAIPKKPKKIIIVQDQDEAISIIRESLDIPTREEFENSEMRAIAECSSAADNNVSCCKTLLLIFTGLLLMRHLFDVLVSGGARHYPFSLVTILFLRASGIIIPMYIIIRIVTALQNSIKQDQNLYNTLIHNTNNREREDDEQEQLHDRDNLDSL